VNFVSFFDSLRFTNWLNNGQGGADTERGAYTLLGGTAIPSNDTTVTADPGANFFLPSENEWYKAAYWDPATQGFLDFPAGSNDRTVCAAPGATPNTANCFGGVGMVTDVGAFTGSASPYGTFDQGGNVWEWNEQIAEGGSFRGIRGGGWFNEASSLAAASSRSILPPAGDGEIVGFRVASRVPEPDASVLAMVALAGLAARQARLERTR